MRFMRFLMHFMTFLLAYFGSVGILLYLFNAQVSINIFACIAAIGTSPIFYWLGKIYE